MQETEPIRAPRKAPGTLRSGRAPIIVPPSRRVARRIEVKARENRDLSRVGSVDPVLRASLLSGALDSSPLLIRRESSPVFAEALRMVGYCAVSNREVGLQSADGPVVIDYCANKQRRLRDERSRRPGLLPTDLGCRGIPWWSEAFYLIGSVGSREGAGGETETNPMIMNCSRHHKRA